MGHSKGVLRIFHSEFFFLFLLFPFIRPQGIDLGFLKNLWLFISMLIVTVLAVKNFPLWYREKCIKYYSLYFVSMLLITVFLTGNIVVGIEKIYAAPVLCVFLTLWLKKNPDLTIKSIVDIFAIYQIISILTWNLSFLEKSNFTFMGVRTLNGIIGVLCIFLGLLYWQLSCSKKEKWKCILLISGSLVEIFGRWISTGIAAIFIFLMVFLFYDRKMVSRSKLIGNPAIMVFIGFFINYLICIVQIQEYFVTIITQVLGETISLNGRVFIWENALEKIYKSPIWGYGVYGVYVQMSQYWGDGNTAFNYVHNQLLQVLLDGGIVLLVSFVILHLYMARSISKIKNVRIRSICIASMFAFLIVMISEEPANYLFYFVYVSIISNISLILNSVQAQGS